MYQPIRLTPKSEAKFMESFSLDPIATPVNIFTEAVFKNGKSQLKGIEEQFQVIKDLLESELAMHGKKGGGKFDPEKFVKNQAWKELEDRMVKIFGFRNVDIMHWNEKYVSESKDFESMELNCYTWPTWRYPIDGLVTDNGFFDSTRSINTSISYSLGVIKELSASELTAVFLHELGHNLDPALVDIKYTKTNILSKYLTDREGSITNQEKKVLEKDSKLGCIGTIIVLLYASIGLAMLIGMIIGFIKGLTFDKDEAISKVKDAIHKDKDKFTRQTNQEAFADNFARMYGYGSNLISAFSKMRGYYDKKLQSRYEKEKSRQRVVADIIMWSLKGVHKTDMHRAHSLVKEYEADLKDPNIPAKVKEGIREDLNELNKVIDEYLNSSDDFSNQLNKVIYDELKKMDPEISKESKSDKKETGKAALTVESILMAECIDSKYFGEKMNLTLVDEATLRRLTDAEAKKAAELFGRVRCTFMHDKHGYFAVNNRARTSFYAKLEDIPTEKVRFVSNIDRERRLA